jgi:hypothetical protein
MKVAPAVMAFVALIATPLLAADPPSGIIDPPPGPQDYIGTFPAHQWVFGNLLWQGSEPCTHVRCEAAYNAEPLFLLVQKEDACCGGPGYSLTVIGRVKGCPSSSYYLAWSKDFDNLGTSGRLAFLSRHVATIAAAISASCGKSLKTPIPTDPLSVLWN